MRISLLATTLTILILLFSGTTTAEAQSSRRLTSTPKSFQTFFLKFKSAVAKRDRNAVAAMTKFPFQYGWDAGDEGTYSRSQFLANYKHIFDGTGRLFAQKNPTFYAENGSFTLTNNDDASHYRFEKRGTTYVFAAIMVEP